MEYILQDKINLRNNVNILTITDCVVLSKCVKLGELLPRHLARFDGTDNLNYRRK